MSYTSIEEVFKAFQDLRVLVIGDVMIDAYIYGSVSRISPEAPVPVVNVVKREKRLGGAANVALNIQALGATPILCALIGDDKEADVFGALLEKRGITDKGIIRSTSRITTVKNRIVSGSQQMLRIDSESNTVLDNLEERSLQNHIHNLLEEVDVVIFEDYDKGCINKTIIESTISMCEKKGIPSAVDPKKDNFLYYIGCTLFKPNLKELKEGLKIDFDSDSIEQLTQAVTQLHKELGFGKALITLSERGVFLYQEGIKPVQQPAHVRRVADVSGAGDTVISIAALCIALDLSNAFLSELANLGGGIVCEYVGVVPIDKIRLLEEAKENDIFELMA